jgi:hypothetical protein
MQQRRDFTGRHVATGVTGAFVVALLLMAACDWMDDPASGQTPQHVYVWPERPPGVDLWPAATYGVHCRPAGTVLARDSGGVVEGVIRENGGRLEVLGGGDFHTWSAVDPSRPPLTSLTYYRVGPCWAGGHGHGQDGEVGASEDDWFPRIYGRSPTEMEKVDIKYYPMTTPPLGIWWLKAEYSRLTGEPVPTPTPDSTPARPCIRPCRWVTQFGVRTCECPAEPVATPTPPPAPTPPVVNPTPCPPTPCPKCSTVTRVTISQSCRDATE